MTQLTFCFLFDTVVPPKPSGGYANRLGAHSSPTSKRRPTRDKKCAAVAVSRRVSRRRIMGQRRILLRRAWPFAGCPYKRLIVSVPCPYDFGSLLYLRRFQRRNESIADSWMRPQKETTMHLTSLQYLFLVPVGLGLAFMFWALWNFTDQLAHRNDSTDKQPKISIRVEEQYALGRQPPGTPRSEVAPQLARVSDSGVRTGYQGSRQSFQTPSAPTLGIGLRRTSSSSIPGAHR